eukprot:scaffold1536_cov397-Prasinococcus_capsulatus_cf.AAC.17
MLRRTPPITISYLKPVSLYTSMRCRSGFRTTANCVYSSGCSRVGEFLPDARPTKPWGKRD